MKRYFPKGRAALAILAASISIASAQTTTSRGTPTISGFAPNAVSGFTAQPVTGFTPAPVQGLAPLPVFPTVTNFTTGPISPLTTTVAGTNVGFAPTPVPPPLPTAPIAGTNFVTNEVGTPLF